MNKAAAALLVLGSLQMAADALGLATLKGIAAATAASPAPKVFTSIRGYEGFSSRFFVEWRDHEGRSHSLELTPEVYERLRGPYNRRNVFGAVLAMGPVLAADPRLAPLFRTVAGSALCGDAPVLRELGLDPSRFAGPPRVRYQPRPGVRHDGLPLVLEAPCEGPAGKAGGP